MGDCGGRVEGPATVRTRSIPLGGTDAALIALAERLGVTEVATVDRRYFTVVRPRHVESFVLVPDLT